MIDNLYEPNKAITNIRNKYKIQDLTLPLGLITEALKYKATDIHLKTDSKIYFRINGELICMEDFPIMNRYDILNFAATLDSNTAISKTEINERKTIDFSSFINIEQKNIYFRCNLYKTDNENRYSLAVRILQNKIPTFEELNLPKNIKNLLNYTHGMILISGAAGNGKTTTLASLIEAINSMKNRHIITIEDPIEYRFVSRKSLIEQRQVGGDVNSFPEALRASLREDPDIIVLGELRDKETIRTAIWAAESGHLVLATVHAADAVETIDKIVQYFPNEQEIIRYNLANSLKAVVSQELHPMKNNKDKKICICDFLFTTPAVRTHIRNNELHYIRNDMHMTSGMILREEAIKAYRKRQLID